MRRALIIGIDAYPNARLHGCVNDAQAMGEVLARNANGSKNFDCKLLTAGKIEIDEAALRYHIKELFSFPADVALFYFAGHGQFTTFGGYLVTQDIKRYDEGVPMDDLLKLANRATRKRIIQEVVIILDCCHSGLAGNAEEDDFSWAVLNEGVSILTASRGSQTADEIGGGGVFTGMVCAALDGGAADVTGKVTVASVYTYVDELLGAWEQRPMFKSHVSRLIPLRYCEPEVDLPILRKLSDYFEAADYEYPLDPSYEPDARPKHPEHEEIFAHLQKFRAAHLVVPVGEDHMYFAAMNKKSCKLTPRGQYYWDMIRKGQL
ncbi:caspase family protein [candidate division KSB1 bacterium]|nr:caspase family protein [candidate division KSB1 bacterium]